MYAIKEFFSDLISNWYGRIMISIVVGFAVYFLSDPVIGWYKYHSMEARSFQEIALLCQREDVPDGILTRFAEVKLPDDKLCPTVFWDFEKDFNRAERFNKRYRSDYQKGTRIEITGNKSKELAKLASAAIDQNNCYLLFSPDKWGVRYTPL